MNWFGKKRFLGEVRHPLSLLDLTNATNHWYSLEDKVHMTNIIIVNFHLIVYKSVCKVRMTPPLHISKFTSCWNKASSVVERKAVRNAAYSDQGCFK